MKMYKILKGTETYQKLCDLWKRMDEVTEAAKKLGRELGGTEVATTGTNMAGGIEAIEFPEKPEGWRIVGQSWQKLFAPKANQKETWKRINALPVIKFDELNKIVGFRANQVVSDGNSLGWVKSVSMMQGKGLYLMGVIKGCDYTPPNGDFIEILASEYEKIEKKINKKKEAV